MVAILGLATAVPPYALDQGDVIERALRIYAPVVERFPNLADVFVNAGIERRYSVRPIEWFDAPHDWRDRNDAYLDGASALFEVAARDALDRAKLTARDVDVVVTVSSTGVATPSLEARLAGRLGFRSDVMRVPVFGLGCAGGVSGLSVGARLARAAPGEVVLVVVVELCTLAFRADRSDKADVISSALFGDGAAAVVLRAGDDAEDRATLRVGRTAEHIWPDTLDIMGWSIDPAGFGVVLSRSLPRFVEQKLAAPARKFASTIVGNGRYIFHPGGAKVLDAVQAALGLSNDAVADEREVLRRYGNMSAPTVLFVLERALRRGLDGPAVMAALGPGFTASFAALDAAGAGHA
ncbi:MAG: type III polyketide synthase [Xanthobacteraceae bacterium]|uniref:type III polyketide synthase n=1 Tax=Pseudolabrys sp. TaxID=1960880 RepID=UPI003D0F0363